MPSPTFLKSVDRKVVWVRLPPSLIPVALCLFILLIYLLFPTKNYYFDGLAFAEWIEAAPRLRSALLHPSHLLYEPLGYCAYKGLLGLGAQVRALQAMQITNSVLSAAGAFVMFRALRPTLRSTYLAAALTLLFAFSATWWKFSIDADAYVPSVFFLLVGFCLVLPNREPRPLLAAVALTLAILFHQIAVFAFPAFLLGVYLQALRLPAKERARAVISFAVIAFGLSFAVYYFCFYLSARTLDPRGFVRFITYHDPDLRFSAGLGESLRYTFRGEVRLFFGGRFNLINGLFNPLTIALAAVLLALGCLLGLRLAASVGELPALVGRMLRLDDRHKPLVLLCGMWVGIYEIFLFFWLPFAPLYRLFYLPPLVALIGIALSSPDARPPRYRAATFIAVIALANFLFLIYPYSHVEKYKPGALALEMTQIWARGTVVYYGADNADVSLFRYMNPTTAWKPFPSGTVGVPEDELRHIYDEGHTAWIEATAIDRLSSTVEGLAWLETHAAKESWRELEDKTYNIKFVRIVAHQK